MKRYEVYYSAAGLPKGELPLPAHLVEHHFSCLDSDVSRCLDPKGIRSTVILVSDQGSEYAVVSLDAGGQSLDLDDALADCVRAINLATRGLCFLIRHDSNGANAAAPVKC